MIVVMKDVTQDCVGSEILVETFVTKKVLFFT